MSDTSAGAVPIMLLTDLNVIATPFLGSAIGHWRGRCCTVDAFLRAAAAETWSHDAFVSKHE